jgi:hypothetical protein
VAQVFSLLASQVENLCHHTIVKVVLFIGLPPPALSVHHLMNVAHDTEPITRRDVSYDE